MIDTSQYSQWARTKEINERKRHLLRLLDKAREIWTENKRQKQLDELFFHRK